MAAREYLHRLHPGVYAVGHAALSTEARLAAALLYAGPGAMLSHATAAWWLGFARAPADTISITTARRCQSRPGVSVYGRRELQPIWHRQLRVTPVAHVLVDLADSAEPEQLKRALAEAEYQGWLDFESLKPWLRRGRPGSANWVARSLAMSRAWR
jgi:predicted transcriptional regulator of viral defense system